VIYVYHDVIVNVLSGDRKPGGYCYYFSDLVLLFSYVTITTCLRHAAFGLVLMHDEEAMNCTSSRRAELMRRAMNPQQLGICFRKVVSDGVATANCGQIQLLW
jgi:hypothetical protein